MKGRTTIIIVAIIVAILFSGCIDTVKNAKHTGIVTAIEPTSWPWETYTVYVKTDQAAAQEDVYCLEDKSLLPILENVSANRTKVTLIYKAELAVAPWRCSTVGSDIITGIN